jgi:hypothetical protein
MEQYAYDSEDSVEPSRQIYRELPSNMPTWQTQVKGLVTQ